MRSGDDGVIIKDFEIEGVKELIEQYANSDKQASEATFCSKLCCVPSCGACCNTHSINIETSVFEMLPMAIEMFNERIVEKVYDRLLSIDDDEMVCVAYKPLSADGMSGFCTHHSTRPVMCRMFAGGACTDKYGHKSLVLCKQLKNRLSKNNVNVDSITQEVPVIEEYATSVRGNNGFLSSTLYSINTALKLAIEYILIRNDLLSREQNYKPL